MVIQEVNDCMHLCLAGCMSDPWHLQGLAHFLEHMLFLGTKKYPEENAFEKVGLRLRRTFMHHHFLPSPTRRHNSLIYYYTVMSIHAVDGHRASFSSLFRNMAGSTTPILARNTPTTISMLPPVRCHLAALILLFL